MAGPYGFVVAIFVLAVIIPHIAVGIGAFTIRVIPAGGC